MPRTPFVTTCALLFGSMLVPAADAVTWGRGAGTAAASEFYSRRRVNGTWFTGRFAKAEVDGELARIGRVRRPVRKVVRRIVRKPAPAMSTRPASIVRAPAPAGMRPVSEAPPTSPETGSAPAVDAPPPSAAEPVKDGEVVAAAPVPSPQVAVAPPPSGADPDADRMEKLRLGLQRRALAILAARPDAPTPEPAPLPEGAIRQEKVEPAFPTP